MSRSNPSGRGAPTLTRKKKILTAHFKTDIAEEIKHVKTLKVINIKLSYFNFQYKDSEKYNGMFLKST